MNTRCIGKYGNDNCDCSNGCECAKEENYDRQFSDVTDEEWFFLWILVVLYGAGIYYAAFHLFPH